MFRSPLRRAPESRQVAVDVLGLRDSGSEGHAERVRAVLAKLLDMLPDVPGAAASARLDTGGATVATVRAALTGAATIDDVAALGDDVVGLCRHAFEAQRRQQAGTGSELAAILAIVRDAMATLAGDEAKYSSDVTSSAARLEALHRIPNIDELKRRLLSEAQELKAVAAAREARWRARLTEVEQRVDVLAKELEQKSALASFDPLTGVENRRGVEAKFAYLQSRASQLVVALIDLDGFKHINDTYGHSAGDELLVAVAKGLRDSVRSEDVVGRMGGDEFVLLLEHVTLRQAEHRLRTVLESLARSVEGVIPAQGVTPAVSASCGVAELSAGDTLASLLKRADDALYDAKRLGKSRVVAKAAPLIRDLMKR
jgi:diguanylate cyclase